MGELDLNKIESFTAVQIVSPELQIALLEVEDRVIRESMIARAEIRAKELGLLKAFRSIRKEQERQIREYDRQKQKERDDLEAPYSRPEFYEWGCGPDGAAPIRVIHPEIVRWICENRTFFILGSIPYYYDSGKYVQDDDGRKLKGLIQKCIIPKFCRDSEIQGIYRMILYSGKERKYDDLNHYPAHWVCFRNGIFDPKDETMHEHSEDYFCLNQIPADFDPKADEKSPEFDALMEFNFPDEYDREMVLQFFGLCFTRDTGFQKFLIFQGPGGSGKSTLINLLIYLIGPENCSAETLQGLNERFNATNLFGKLLNACADISSEDMAQVDALKKITGADLQGVKYEKKGKDSFFFTPCAKLLFSANQIPLNRDEKSNAFYRRMLIAVMDRQPEKIDLHLLEKLKAERAGIIHRLMEALERLYAMGGIIESERSRAEVNNLRRAADSVTAFIQDRLCMDNDGRMSRAEIREAYEHYCDQEDRAHPVSRNTLFNRLRAEGFNEVVIHGERFFSGIKQRRPWNESRKEGFLDEEAGQTEIPFDD